MNQLDTKEKLLNSANQLIKSVGVNAMSYADLSKEVGISKASIHHHFPKKEDLIIALIRRTNDIYGVIFHDIIQEPIFGIEKLYKIATIYTPGECKNKKCLLGMLSAEFASLGENVQKELQIAVQIPIKHLRLAFEQAIEEGAVRNQFKAADLAYTLYALILGSQIISRVGHGSSFQESISQFLESL